jgi:hypothetical protein
MNTLYCSKGIITSIVPLCLAPMLSLATPELARQPAMDACIKAFVSTSLSKMQSVAVRAEDLPERPRSTKNRRYKISLVATDQATGRRLATATCLADRNGAILAVNGKAPSALVASAQ